MSDTPTMPTHYKHHRTYIVDQNTSNDSYLVRGNLPLLDDGTFAWTKLNARLQELIGTGFDLGDYTFIDVTLIDDQGEDIAFEAELKVFGIDSGDPSNEWAKLWPPYYQYNLTANQGKGYDIKTLHGTDISGDASHKGGLVWWPVQPCDGTSSSCTNIEINQFAFPDLIEYLSTLLSTKQKTIIYFHCMHGHDRTSAVAASYLMKYKGSTLTQAQNDPPPTGAFIDGFEWEGDYPKLVQWYYDTYVKS